MFTRPTVFVVGAGASAEYHLPTGTEMNASISLALNFSGGTSVGHGDRHMFDMLGNRFGQPPLSKVDDALDEFPHSQFSIDFLHKSLA